MRMQLLRALALAGLLALALTRMAAAQGPTIVRAGNIVLAIDGGVSPRRLPRRRLAPIALRVSGAISTANGSQPPAARTVTIEFDKHGTINARGLPTCRAGQLEARTTAAAKVACRRAIVGRGRTTVRVAFPEQQPFDASGPLILFNGGVKGRVTTMLIHAYVDVPTPTAIVTTVRIEKIHAGPYGTRAVAKIPVIAGGSGSLIGFNLAVHRMFRRHGRKQSYLKAECANRRFLAHSTVSFSDGSLVSGSVARTCRQR